ncbi:MAG: ribosomal RNA small subunit methyltransferase A [Balneolaceae bacterium]|nr:ribosomal RNA small subunit methyltransferase A [Balneolaceae bacterium]MBO6546802.1 ribosomal RNA small subunit methyltransferase A [Balneolaceae bacterium]MBO6649162.1 ribosomal RNA small subunit methyltransferase A [Balneolaceae bacterium]
MSFKTKKSLGQHFLTDNNIIAKILKSVNAKDGDRVIEIGPGTGALTKWLVQQHKDVHAIEVDQRAVEVLVQTLEGLIIHQKDVLKVNWEELISDSGDTLIIGNLPYYITSPILFSLLESRQYFKEAILMMQREVAQRLVASPSTKDYGILSVQTQLMSTPELLFDVSPNSFSPPPKVMSSVIRLTFDKPDLPCTDQTLKSVVRTAFNQRRKKLSNSLKPVLSDFFPDGFNYDERAENWSPAIYADLAEQLEKSRSQE